ncbi:MAG: 16S rRNA (adenine(1518)-N(6)/adenine(1519)-N(6))-dimethyltransferase RsmA [Thermoplasmatota archaeon]
MNEKVKNRLNKVGITATKSLGQNFLNDDNIAEKIVNSANIKSDEKILEIGPGLGILTDIIVKRAKKTILIEKDDAIAGYLEGRYSDKNLEIIHGDVLEIDLPDFDKVVSNLPFNISSPVTFKLLNNDFDYGVLTYQKEYADRMCAGVGEKSYSRLSVMVSTFAEVERLFDISKNSFYPPPKVDATVLKLTPRAPQFNLKYPEIFSDVVRELFNYRRKTIRNGLRNGFDIDVKTEDIPFGRKRVEKLAPEQISELTTFLVGNNIIDR